MDYSNVTSVTYEDTSVNKTEQNGVNKWLRPYTLTINLGTGVASSSVVTTYNLDGSDVESTQSCTSATTPITTKYSATYTITSVASVGYNDVDVITGTISTDTTKTPKTTPKPYTLTKTINTGIASYVVTRTSSPLGKATLGELSDGAVIYYNDVLSISNVVASTGYNVDAYTSSITVDGDETISPTATRQTFSVSFSASNEFAWDDSSTITAQYGDKFTKTTTTTTSGDNTIITITYNHYAWDDTNDTTSLATRVCTKTFLTAKYDVVVTSTDAIGSVTSATTISASATNTIKSYTITWVNDGNTTTETYEYDKTPSISDPTKSADAQFTYTFSGWAPTITKVTGDATYTAVYTSTTNQYTITWKDGDGNNLKVEEVAYGVRPSYSDDDATPTKTADAQYTYAFNNTWSPNIVDVVGNATYTAQFNSTIRTYTITWVLNNGDADDTTTVAYGVKPTHADPTKEGEGHTYVFSKWSPTIVSVTGDATYTAIYKETTNQYLIRFVDYDSEASKTTTLHSDYYDYGTTLTYNTTPTRNKTAQYTYEFLGWGTSEGATEVLDSLPNVSSDATYYAIWEATTNQYTITWIDGDGKTLKTETLNYGTTPSYSGDTTPTKTQTAQYTYTFNNTWSPNIVDVVGNATYTAQFDSTIRSYTITWVLGNGEANDTTTLNYGATPSHASPTKSATAQYTYTFNGWTPAITSVTGNKTYTATYVETINQYTITFTDDDDSVISSELYNYGDTPSCDSPSKDATAQFTYTFSGWNPPITSVTGTQTYKATYSSVVNTYTITWNNYDGTTLKTDTIAYGETPSYSGDTPTKASDNTYDYTFDGWDSTITSVTGNKTYTAQYSSSLREYTITFAKANTDGSWSNETKVAYYNDVITRSDNTITCTGNANWSVTYTEGSTSGYTYSTTYDNDDSFTVNGNATITATTTKVAILRIGSYTDPYATLLKFGGTASSESYTYKISPITIVNSTPVNIKLSISLAYIMGGEIQSHKLMLSETVGVGETSTATEEETAIVGSGVTIQITIMAIDRTNTNNFTTNVVNYDTNYIIG